MVAEPEVRDHQPCAQKTEETIREERNVHVGKLSSKTTRLPEDGRSALSDRSVRIDRIHHLTHRERRWTGILRQRPNDPTIGSMTTTPEAVRAAGDDPRYLAVVSRASRW